MGRLNSIVLQYFGIEIFSSIAISVFFNQIIAILVILS